MSEQPKRGRQRRDSESRPDGQSNLERMAALLSDQPSARGRQLHHARQQPKATKTRAVPDILPREPLTKKARSAIATYAYSRVMMDVITACLKAERMRRSALYAALAKEGYRWDSKKGWRK